MNGPSLQSLAAACAGGGVVVAALAVFLAGPPPLVRLSRVLAVAALVLGALGAGHALWASGGAMDPRQRGGAGSLFAAAGTLLLTFGALRVAERRRLDRVRAEAKAKTAQA